MDQATLSAYDAAAASFAQDWESQPAPTDLHALLSRFLIPGTCADIGCGSGREVAWLDANGFQVCGYDASQGLLTQARLHHPHSEFRYAALPDLDGIADASVDNVVCETVIMHLPPAHIAAAARRLLAIVKPGGILYLSWRITEDANLRDKNDRLYAAFDAALVRQALAEATPLLDEAVVSVSSGKKIHRLIVRKDVR
ncbi:class I SAM-dependent methyltransferase [Herbaspirillum autotrophicum]|uniref:class I SAM-dependent methyltransferase n=1 Tax=Herbaspirillum autotrophicum TaxID=180195 RepID=UPI00067B5779|nr:methyltransferase domain-containing protein [Herbaspirillum autotrophicum]